ncbi:hypothetical protein StoSoilB13_09030 [Arthrobacter sp. StoSoilB13]|nr:hypothetical protein StoSoilB13_09030 [Arthrobacter sp. StoSoilB13]
MVRVQENRGLAIAGRTAGDDGGTPGRPVRFVAAQNSYVIHSRCPYQGGDSFGAAIQFGGFEAWPRDSRDTDKILQGAKSRAE